VSKRTLLLADDSVTIQKVVNLTFADEGIDVITVGDGDSAMEKISQFTPDVVLADVHMPGLSGYRICEIIRENPSTKDLPVILLVGSFEPFDESEAARVGANAYLTKPFQSIRQLVSQVTDLMGDSDAIEEQSIPVAAVEPVAAVPDTSDIDSLYERSFLDQDVAESDSARPYVDVGMDDEMIETRSVESSEPEYGSAQYDAPESASRPEGAAYSHEPEAEYGYETHPGNESRPSGESFHEEAEHVTEPNVGARPFDSYAEDAESAPEESSSGYDEFSRTEQIPEFMHTQGGTPIRLDESELLELPPIENGKTLEFTTTQRSMAEGEKKEVVTLSPELMEILVQKVVEKLSEKY
jgi:CheY-like chemotaxis protein